jgi:predicted N-formylglutamate amidohydrolase
MLAQSHRIAVTVAGKMTDREDRHLDQRCADSPARSNRLLGTDDLPPVVVTNQGGRSPFLLLGDHAGRAIPRTLGDLGVPAAEMDRHIAWDIGIAATGERLAAALDACFIRQTYSRLVIDCNRKPDAPDLAPAVSDGTTIPANVDLTQADRARRLAEIHQPYQAAIADIIAQRTARGQPTVLVSLHSFTPSMAGIARPWLYGVLHRNDSPFSEAVLAQLRAMFGDRAGDNQPYAMDGRDNTIPRHADGNGLDYLELEIRQDLIAGPEGQAAASALLADLLPRALAALPSAEDDR